MGQDELLGAATERSRVVGVSEAAADEVFHVSGVLDDDGCVTIKHLAGQRTADLEWLTRNETGTVKQRQALSNALAGWAELEARRAYIAHGVVTVRVDKNGLWRARVDFTAYRNGPGEKCRWSFSRTEADDFEMSLERGFRALSAQLGQLRKRLAA